MFPSDRELVVTRLMDAPREAIYRCWTESALLKQWFAPRPQTTPVATVQMWVGGENRIVFEGPDGHRLRTAGVFLEVVANERLVFTDAFESAWDPRDGNPFVLVIITFEDEHGKTRYTVRARHWTVEACAQYKAIGFHESWSRSSEQLEALARTL